jgi:hypothetical protein
MECFVDLQLVLVLLVSEGDSRAQEQEQRGRQVDAATDSKSAMVG